MLGYDVFGAFMRTDGGNRLAVAGICRAGSAAACESAAQKLSTLEFNTEDPTEIDAVLAGALSELYDGLAAAVGASVYIESVSGRVYRTGGVLGRPEEAADDADGDLEELDANMWMFTAPGGPGWIAFLPRAEAERLAEKTVSGSGAYPIHVTEVYRSLMSASPEAYVFVSDGTGYDSLGLCAAKCGGREFSFSV